MELQARFANGDREAFETLFRQFQGQVFRWIVRIVRDPAAAEDLTVEAFWRIYRAHARFRPDGNFGAWAHRIAINVAIDHLHRTRSELPLPENLPDKPEADSAVRRDTREKVARAFSKLPAKYQAPAMLALVEEEPYSEIAATLGISEGAVKTRVFRAVRLLRKELDLLGVRP
jgi:RNA polymerase sigma-70 factor (ECF subfamily)